MISNRAQRRTGRTGCRPRLEPLEARLVLSGGVSAADALIEATATRTAYGVDGTGLAAAMIDTGVAYTNPDLGSDPTYGPGHKVSDGYDFTKNVSNPYPVSDHGTSTAGIVAGVDPNHPGVAPGANIVALRVFADDGSGDFSNVLRALQYALDHRVQDHISVVNLSISDGGNYSYDFFSNDNSLGQQLATLIHELDQVNVPVVVATGNSFNGSPGVGFPAILSETISVTGTTLGDQIVPNAQRLDPADGGGAATDLAAPGQGIVVTSFNGYQTVEGTSYAAPEVTGGIILLQQIYQQRFGTLPSVASVESWLQNGSVKVYDPATHASYDRIDILKAASLIPAKATPQTNVYLNGQLTATVPSTAIQDPMAGFSNGAGGTINFNLVQVYSNSGNSSVYQAAKVTDPTTFHYDNVELFTTPHPTSTIAPLPPPQTPTPPKTTGSTTTTTTSLDLRLTAGLRRGHAADDLLAQLRQPGLGLPRQVLPELLDEAR